MRSSFRLKSMLMLLLTLIISSGLAIAQDTAALDLSSAWRIRVSQEAASGGDLYFLISPERGIALEVAVNVEEGRNADGIAKDISDRLSQTLDAKGYSVGVENDKHVLIQARGKTGRFELRLLESTISGTRISLDKV